MTLIKPDSILHARTPPTLNGISPSRVFLPTGKWITYEDFLTERFPAIDLAEWQDRIKRKEVLNSSGIPISLAQPYQSGKWLYYYRRLQTEPAIPFSESIIYQDEYLVVADKPHFLPVIPSGRYLQETLLVRLKRRLGIETLSPIHRIDRETAGLVIFSVQPETRSLYQSLFSGKEVEKYYEAIAPYRKDIPLPSHYKSRLVPNKEVFMQMQEVDGAPNAETAIQLLETKENLARYALRPLTGKKHQLRVHMLMLGLPILNDRIYPFLLPEEKDKASWENAFANPLQLLAKSIAFTDPVTKQHRYFESKQNLRL